MRQNNKRVGASYRPPDSVADGPFAVVRREAENEGFVATGFSKVGRPPFFEKFETWLAGGNHGDMQWLERNTEIRADPRLLLEGCESIISLAYPYSPKKPSTADNLRAARFTEPQKKDYHFRIKEKAQRVAQRVSVLYPGSRWRVCVDSAPVLERSFAYLSGIGFIGKNNMLIIPGYGSFVFLAEVLTTAGLPAPQTSPLENQCGECQLCVHACPTGALEMPFSLDAKKCLSYLTIEYKGPIESETGRKMGDCFFGCDVCQEVCPFNGQNAGSEIAMPFSDDILDMTKKEFKKVFGNTAFSRSGLEKLRNNIMAMRKDGII